MSTEIKSVAATVRLFLDVFAELVETRLKVVEQQSFTRTDYYGGMADGLRYVHQMLKGYADRLSEVTDKIPEIPGATVVAVNEGPPTESAVELLKRAPSKLKLEDPEFWVRLIAKLFPAGQIVAVREALMLLMPYMREHHAQICEKLGNAIADLKPGAEQCAAAIRGLETAAAVEKEEERQFPLMDSPRGFLKTLPWEMLVPHERQAQINHGQSLERLAERGGLCPSEAVAVLEDRRWRSMPGVEASMQLSTLVHEWRMKQRKGGQ